MKTFTASINASSLNVLVMNSNAKGQSFMAAMLDALDCPSLCTLAISDLSLQDDIVPSLTRFATSLRCRLLTLRMNSNPLTLRGLKTIVASLRDNYSLKTFEFQSGSADMRQSGRSVWRHHRLACGRSLD